MADIQDQEGYSGEHRTPAWLLDRLKAKAKIKANADSGSRYDTELAILKAATSVHRTLP